MKLQLDTENKIIKIEERVNLGTLIKTLEALLPKGRWREFELDTSSQINWTYPIYVPYEIPWWQRPWIIYGSTAGYSESSPTLSSSNEISEPADYSLQSGVFNIQVSDE
jgi:hypothetical protein